MDFNRCSRCGSFYLSQDSVCPKCLAKDNLEFSTFQNYIEENGLDNSLNEISGKTGISIKNLNRFLDYNSMSNNIQTENDISNNISKNITKL